jgi:tRNA U34 5-methylaminomethyl-2-thiouridine-forming methyltransferase MnmC
MRNQQRNEAAMPQSILNCRQQILSFMPNNKSILSVIKTADGSNSIRNHVINENYHSHFGALQESRYVFILNGIQLVNKTNIRILEIGLGTGLNAALTAQYCLENQIHVHYTAIEPFPLTSDIIEDYVEGFDDALAKVMLWITECNFDSEYTLNLNFKFLKQQQKLENYSSTDVFDLIYFDAFSPEVQPELWTESIFTALFQVLKQDGILTTYCAKGQVKRNLKAAGFAVKSLPGPPGKREMTIGVKS